MVLPSTIVDLSITPPKILREGPITKEEIIEVIKNLTTGA